MRRALALLVIAACGHPAAPVTPPAPQRTAPRLRPPPALDASVRGASYLSAVALQLQPGWGQFLDDCRLRLPVGHPLNEPSLATTAELAIDARGQVVDVAVAPSGNADFDQAVRDALRDANPLPAPPVSLWSDDDLVHLRWLFARDRRQAGPATAQVIDLDLPLPGVVDRLVRAGQLTRAAKRILRAPVSAEREAATRVLALAGLREGLGSADGAVRRAAVDAIGRAGVHELAPEVRALLTGTNDDELRLVAIASGAVLGDDSAAPVLVEQLKRDVVENARLAHAEIRALVALHREADVAAILRGMLDRQGAPNPVALESAGHVALPELTRQIGTWVTRGDARTRAAACTALASVDVATAKPWLAKGLGDRDASVRAACIGAVRDPKLVRGALRRLVTDRDERVRAAAVAALARIDDKLDVLGDPAAAVRIAYAGALAPDAPAVIELMSDRDPDVRAAAWARFPRSAARNKTALTQAVAGDPAAQVRRAAIPALEDGTIAYLAAHDDASDVRTEALVELCARRGRTAMTDMLLGQLADAEPGSAQRVRASLAWLLAP